MTISVSDIPIGKKQMYMGMTPVWSLRFFFQKKLKKKKKVAQTIFPLIGAPPSLNACKYSLQCAKIGDGKSCFLPFFFQSD